MLSAEEIASVQIFADLEPEERERIARAAADVWLERGEYAAEEGAGQALFGLLEGKVEAVKLQDGVDRVVGTRLPGDVFGEVSIVLGTVHPVSFRAAARSRVLRLEPADYHTLAAAAPAVAQRVGELAAYRMTGSAGLQGLAARAPAPRAVVVGQRWDAGCGELRRFLDRNQISFKWVTPDAGDAEAAWGGPLPAEDELPAIRTNDGMTLVQPPFRLVAEVLGLTTEPAEDEYDVVVVGAGPAGLAAAVYGASEGLRTIVVEQEAPGGQAGTSSRIENYLGFPQGVSGDELASRALQQAKRLGAEILVTRRISAIDGSRRRLVLDGGDTLDARTIILACGVTWRRLAVEGFDRLAGKGIHYGASRSEAPSMHGLDVHIVGAGNSAGQAAIFFSTHARSVTFLVRGANLRKSMSQYLVDQIGRRPNIHARYRVEVVAAHGDEALNALEIRNLDLGDVTRIDSSGLFIFIGADAETSWLPPEIALDPRGYVLTGSDVTAAGRWQLERDPYLLETSVPGIFACGDVRYGPVKRVAAAVGEGSMAIAFIHQFLRDADERAMLAR